MADIDERIKNFLLRLCVEQHDKLESAKQENGMEESVLTVDGKVPEFQKTINRLIKQIDRQDRWLRQRKEEVTVLQNSLKEYKSRKDYYKDVAKRACKMVNDTKYLCKEGTPF